MTERERALRSLLLALVLLGCAGLVVELLLVEHTESFWQWLPLVLLPAGAVAAGAVLIRPTRSTVLLFRLAMALVLVTGVVGIWLHFQGNRLFELEMEPSQRGLALAWAAVRGGVPSLAPGAMVQLALLGFIAMFRHPAAEGAANHPTPETP